MKRIFTLFGYTLYRSILTNTLYITLPSEYIKKGDVIVYLKSGQQYIVWNIISNIFVKTNNLFEDDGLNLKDCVKVVLEIG